MILPAAILTASVIILIYSALMYFFEWYKPVRETDEGQILLEPLIEATNLWSVAQQPDPERGECASYNTLLPNLNVADYYEGLPINKEYADITCKDGRNMLLRKVTRTCNAPSGKVCIGSDGRRYEPQEVETYYEECKSKECDVASVIGQNIRMAGGVLIDDAICLNSAEFTTTRCKLRPSDTQTFKIEKRPISTNINGVEIEVEDMRISIPGTHMCLGVDSNNSSPGFYACKNLDETGFIWYYTPDIPLEFGRLIPSQLILKASVEMPSLRSLQLGVSGQMSLTGLRQCNDPSTCAHKILIDPINMWEQRKQ